MLKRAEGVQSLQNCLDHSFLLFSFKFHQGLFWGPVLGYPDQTKREGYEQMEFQGPVL